MQGCQENEKSDKLNAEFATPYLLVCSKPPFITMTIDITLLFA